MVSSLTSFYYIDAGKHLSLGYVDFPLFIGLLTAFTHNILGDSLMAYRFFPAITGAIIVLLAGIITRELGGRPLTQFLVALAIMMSPENLWLSSTLTTGSFDPLWWVIATYVLVLLIKREQPRFWLLFGCVLGIGVMTKLTILFFGVAIVLGLLLTPQRRYLFSKWAWIGGGIVLACLIPYLYWNAVNSWPTATFYQSYNNAHSTPMDAIGSFLLQAFMVSPILLPLWLVGLYCLFFTQAMKPYRVFGCSFVILYVFFNTSQAHFYFLAPAYIMLLAAGAITLDRRIHKPRWQWVKPTYIALVALVGLLMMSYAIPILPLQVFAKMYARGGNHAGSATSDANNLAILIPQKLSPSGNKTGIQPKILARPARLPEQYELEMDWQSMVATIAQAYHRLPPAEQSKACILVSTYGVAGAINYYGPQYHLPQAISGHNSYYFWGPGTCTGEVVILFGFPLDLLQSEFSSVTQVGVNACQYCIPYFDQMPIYVGRHIKTSMKGEWAKFRLFL